jgi:hypothetical protein
MKWTCIGPLLSTLDRRRNVACEPACVRPLLAPLALSLLFAARPVRAEGVWLDLEVGSASLENGRALGAATGLRFGAVALGAVGRAHAGEGEAWQLGGVARWHGALPPDIFTRASPFLGVHALYTARDGAPRAVDLGLSSGLDVHLTPYAAIGLGLDVGALVADDRTVSALGLLALRSSFDLRAR